MLMVLVSRFFYIPGHLSNLGLGPSLDASTISTLTTLGEVVFALVLLFGAGMILSALIKGIIAHRRERGRDLILAEALMD